jgi:hypothetical protein
MRIFLVLMSLLALVVIAILVKWSPMPLPQELEEIDAALRGRGVTPKHSREFWRARVPPEAVGPEVHGTFSSYSSNSRGWTSRKEYVFYCTISVSKEGMVYVRPTFRTEDDQHRGTTIGRLGEHLHDDVKRQFYNVHWEGKATTEYWLKEVLLKNIHDPKFPEWMKELE